MVSVLFFKPYLYNIKTKSILNYIYNNKIVTFSIMPKRVNPKNNKGTPSKNVILKKSNIGENVLKRVELLRSIVQKTIVSAQLTINRWMFRHK